MKKQSGFTLAEVLITLGIIGVVAAMTIPTLMNSTGQAEFKSGFKKAISALNQAITMNVALADSDFSVLTAGATATAYTTDGTVFNMFGSRLNVVSTTTGTDAGLNAGTPVPATMATTSNFTLFLNDGQAISFPQATAGCLQNVYASGCTAIVDVNGAKKPNRLSNCLGTATAVDRTACTKASLIVGDRFSIRFLGNQIQPNGEAARFVMYN